MRASTARVALALAVFAACAPERRALEPLAGHGLPTAADGREAYGRACASCHGADARGSRPAADDVTGPAPDLTGLAARHGGIFPREWVIAVVGGEVPIAAHGEREMPVWQQRFGPRSGATAAAAFYERRRMEALADYLASLQRPPDPAP